MSAQPFVARLLSGRALWIALGIVLAALYAYLSHRARGTRISTRMEHRRGRASAGALDANGLREALRNELAVVAKLPLVELHPDDRLQNDYELGLQETRALVDALEARFDCSLPDARVVRAMTVGELLQVLARRTGARLEPQEDRSSSD